MIPAQYEPRGPDILTDDLLSQRGAPNIEDKTLWQRENKIIPRFWSIYTISTPLNMKRSVLERGLSAHACMYLSLAPYGWTDYSHIQHLGIYLPYVGNRVNMNILVKKLWIFTGAPKRKIANFSNKIKTNFIIFQ